MKVKIYGRSSGCSFCDTAKQVCESNNFEYDFIDIAENGIDGAKLAEICGTAVRTVPQIFVNEQYAGGCTEFVNGLKQGIWK